MMNKVIAEGSKCSSHLCLTASSGGVILGSQILIFLVIENSRIRKKKVKYMAAVNGLNLR